mgnify:CR=1 FL=1
MACPRFQKYTTCKDPDSEVDYGRNWGPSSSDPGWLQTDEEIVSSNWVITETTGVEPVPTLIVGAQGESIAIDKKSTLIWLEGGTVGLSYSLENTITTDQGRVEQRTGILQIAEK